MALVVKERIKETTATSGTGTLTLSGAVNGFRPFSDIGNNNTTFYCISDDNNNTFEVGLGTYNANTLTRDTVFQTSSGNTTKINFASGNKEVFVTYVAEKSVHKDANGDIDTTGKIKFANVYSQTSDLPSASTYHGMFAHVHGTGKGYFAHAGNWVELANASDLSSYLLSSAVSSYGATLIDDADAPTARTTLGLGTMAVETASDYLTTSSASSTYLTQSSASSTYLTQSSASSTYLTQSSASSTYLTQSSASSTYAQLSGADFTGDISVTSSTNAKLTINDNIGEVGSGNLALQASNSAETALRPLGLRGDDIRLATGSYGVGINATPSNARGSYSDLVIGKGNESGTKEPQIEFYNTSTSWAINHETTNSQMGFHYNNGSSWSQILALKSGSSDFSNTVVSSVDFRAPIFYDSSNTSYYVDPASTSLLNYANVGTNFQAGTTSTLNSRGTIAVYRNSSPFISFHDSTLDRTAYIQETSGAFYLWEATFTEMSGQARAPIFYDSNNTSYYVDPASTSNMYRAVVTDYIYTPIVYDNNNSSYYVDPSSTSSLYNVTVHNQLYLNTNTTLSSAGTVGVAGQVLTSNGNARPTWQDAGGGAWEVIGNYTGTNVNSLDFVHGSNGFVFDATTYKHIHMYATFNNYANYSGATLKIFPLVGTTSSYTAMSNLAFQYQWWNELYPEFTGVSYGSYQHGANAQYANNNQGAIIANIKMDQNASSAGSAGMAMFSETINGTYHSSQPRYYSTNVQMEFPCWGIDTDRSFAGTGKVWYDDPSIFAYSRNFVWQCLGWGYGKVGFRFIAQSSSSRWDYDITWIGLKP